MDYKNIIQGFINAGRSLVKFSSPEVEKLALQRYNICLKCSKISDDKSRCDRKKGGCGCILAAKTRSNSSCPDGKWL